MHTLSWLYSNSINGVCVYLHARVCVPVCAYILLVLSFSSVAHNPTCFYLHQQTEFRHKEHQGPFLRTEMYKSVFEDFPEQVVFFFRGAEGGLL